MAIPYQIQLEQLARVALRKASQPAPSNGMIEEAKTVLFAEVKNDIKFKAPTHKLLEQKEIIVTTRAVRTVSQPTKAHKNKSALLLVGPDAWQGTAQTGGAATITLAAAFSEDEGTIKGNMLVTLGGTGSLQYRHITAYSNSTKIATVSPAWTTAPDNTTTYLVVQKQVDMLKASAASLNRNAFITGEGEPLYGSMQGEALWFNQSPNKIYPILWTYYIDIDQLDESDTVILKILREWHSVIAAGLAAKCAAVYDDTRWGDYTLVYNDLLGRLQFEALPELEQTQPYDPVLPYMPYSGSYD